MRQAEAVLAKAQARTFAVLVSVGSLTAPSRHKEKHARNFDLARTGRNDEAIAGKRSGAGLRGSPQH